MSCQSSLYLRCAKVYVDNWGSQVSQRLHEDVIYRPIVLTVLEIVRQTFAQHAAGWLSAFMRGGVRCLAEVFSRVSGQDLKGGYIVLIQTHGRHGPYNPQLHLMAPSGGWDHTAQPWVPLDDVPYAMRRNKWQGHLLTMRRQMRHYRQ